MEHYNFRGLFESKNKSETDRNISYISHKWHSPMQFLFNTLANCRFAAVKLSFLINFAMRWGLNMRGCVLCVRPPLRLSVLTKITSSDCCMLLLLATATPKLSDTRPYSHNGYSTKREPRWGLHMPILSVACCLFA